MNEDCQIKAESHRNHKLEYYDDEIELMDYLLVIWKWKYVILAGTLAFGIAAAIISFIILKQQPIMYRTSIVLKPGIVKIDENGKKVFIDTPENIKNLIENDLKYNILGQIKNSNNSKLSTALDFQVDMPKGSDKINVSLESASVEYGMTKLNYLIKDLSDESTEKAKFIKEKIEKQIEEKKHEFNILLLKEKEIKSMIKKYENKLSEIESNRKLLKEKGDNSQSREYFLNKLSVENNYLNTFQTYFNENEKAKLNLFGIQIKNDGLSIEIAKLEKEKQNIQIIQIVQPPITTELPKTNKIRRNLIRSSVTGFLSMLFLSFFLEYIQKYKKRAAEKLV